MKLAAVSNKKPKFRPKVATQAWWIEEIKKDPIYQYTEEWTKHSDYQVARWKILAELDYKVLGTSILRGAPGLGQTYPPKIQFKPSWFKPSGTSTPQLKTSRKEPSSYLASSRKSLLLSGTITKGVSTNWYTLPLLSLTPLFWIFL